MNCPPHNLTSFDARRELWLVAYVPHEQLYGTSQASDPWYLSIYCSTASPNAEYFVVLVNHDASKQRHFMRAGASFEYAFIVASALFPITPAQMRDVLTYADVRIFVGRLSPERGRYRKLLHSVQSLLSRLRSDYSEMHRHAPSRDKS